MNYPVRVLYIDGNGCSFANGGGVIKFFSGVDFEVFNEDLKSKGAMGSAMGSRLVIHRKRAVLLQHGQSTENRISRRVVPHNEPRCRAPVYFNYDSQRRYILSLFEDSQEHSMRNGMPAV